MSWELVPLEEVATSIVDGPFGSNLKASDYRDYGVPVLQGKNVTGNQFRWHSIRFISSEKAKSLIRSEARLGDHLLVKIGSIGYSAILDDLHGHPFSIIPANLARIRPNKAIVDPRYLHRFLTSRETARYFKRIASRTAQPALSLKKIRMTQIPLPPLDAQKRIAAILDAADALRAKRRESIEQLDALVQSTFLDMFGDPVDNPKGWPVGKSGQLFLEKPKIGTTQPARGSGYLVVRVGQLGQPRIRFEECSRVELEPPEARRYALRPGDIAIARAIGSREQLGKASLFQGHTEEAIIDSHVMLLRPSQSKCHPVWLYALLSSEVGRRMIQKHGGATAIQFNINSKQVSSLDIPVPPLSMQEEFASIFEAVQLHRGVLNEHLDFVGRLFESLQQRAFSGDL